MEKRIEKWESLRLEAQQFMPQEYCETCWIATVKCIGESASQGHFIRYITFPPDTHEYDMHWNGHTEHPVTYHLRLPDDVTPTSDNFVNLTDYIIAVYDPQYSSTTGDNIEIAHGRSSSNHEQFDGWGWLVGGNVHFTYDPEFQMYQQSPNHS